MTLSKKIGDIFDPILQCIFKSSYFSEECNKVINNLSKATIELWNKIKSTLLPTPAKFHYLFNLRDVSRVFKGMCQVIPDTINNSASIGTDVMKPEILLISLWKHECERVFMDKLVNKKDKKVASDLIEKTCLDVFEEWKEKVENQVVTKK